MCQVLVEFFTPLTDVVRLLIDLKKLCSEILSSIILFLIKYRLNFMGLKYLQFNYLLLEI